MPWEGKTILAATALGSTILRIEDQDQAERDVVKLVADHTGETVR